MLKYIGKSKGKYFRQRIRNHFYIRNRRTGSKLEKIEKEKKDGNSVVLSYITTEPESLQNLIEEELILKYKEQLWNR